MDIGGRKLVSIPYSYEINDSPFLQTRNHTIDEFVTAIKRQFDTLYAEGAQSGRVMAICLHPYLIGVPHRIKGLDDALSYIAAHDGVWFATGERDRAGLAANRARRFEPGRRSSDRSAMPARCRRSEVSTANGIRSNSTAAPIACPPARPS